MKDTTANRLITVKEMAEIIGVSPSWLYQRTRFGSKSIPHMRFGKYIRFNPGVVIAFFAEQEKDSECLFQ